MLAHQPQTEAVQRPDVRRLEQSQLLRQPSLLPPSRQFLSLDKPTATTPSPPPGERAGVRGRENTSKALSQKAQSIARTCLLLLALARERAGVRASFLTIPSVPQLRNLPLKSRANLFPHVRRRRLRERDQQQFIQRHRRRFLQQAMQAARHQRAGFARARARHHQHVAARRHRFPLSRSKLIHAVTPESPRIVLTFQAFPIVFVVVLVLDPQIPFTLHF